MTAAAGPPVLGLVARPGEGEPLRPLVRALSTRVRVRALSRLDGPPDAVLATSHAALGQLDPSWDGPTAVWIAYGHGHRVELLTDGIATLVEVGVLVPDLPDVAARSPLLRRRWRERLGLPAALVLDTTAPPDPTTGWFVSANAPDRLVEGHEDVAAQLALASAAVVGADLLPLALALGTPIVTNAAAALALDLTDGLELDVVDNPELAQARAEELAHDDVAASARSRRAVRAAQERSPEHLADVLTTRLHVARPALGTKARVLHELEQLGLPASSPLRARVDHAFAAF